MNNVILKPQECTGNYLFDGQMYMTAGFQSEFGEDAPIVIMETMHLIYKRRDTVGADYLQTAEYNGIKFWVIDDVTHITFLLPSDYYTKRLAEGVIFMPSAGLLKGENLYAKTEYQRTLSKAGACFGKHQ